MRMATLGLLVVACSSPPAKPTTAAPEVEVAPAPLDAAPAIVEASAPDAEPEGRMPACLDARFAASTSNDGSAPALGAVGSDLAAVPYPAVICPE